MVKAQHDISSFVNAKIYSLINYSDESQCRATLAKLRRGIGKKPGSLPDIWDYTLQGLPEELMTKNDEPTRAQWAVYLSITLFSLHQQGKNPKENPMSNSDKSLSLGRAVRTLISRRNDETEDAIKRRFDTVITSNSPEELAHHLRGLISLLKSGDVPLNYPRLAEDLYNFFSPDNRSGVLLQWGQDYYKIKREEEDNNEK